MARQENLLDQYRDELIELKDTLSTSKLADMFMDKYQILITPERIAYWYKKNGLSKSVKPRGGIPRHGG